MLTYVGEGFNTQDPKMIDQTLPVLQTVRLYIRTCSSSDFIARHASGEIYVSLGCSGDILQSSDLADEAGDEIESAYFPFSQGSFL